MMQDTMGRRSGAAAAAAGESLLLPRRRDVCRAVVVVGAAVVAAVVGAAVPPAPPPPPPPLLMMPMPGKTMRMTARYESSYPCRPGRRASQEYPFGKQAANFSTREEVRKKIALQVRDKSLGSAIPNFEIPSQFRDSTPSRHARIATALCRWALVNRKNAKRRKRRRPNAKWDPTKQQHKETDGGFGRVVQIPSWLEAECGSNHWR
jgi:hypothetical protein